MNDVAHGTGIGSFVAWVAAALADIVLALALVCGALFLIYPYDLPLNNRDFRALPELAAGELVDVTATNAWYRQPINTSVEFFTTGSAGAVNSREYVLYRDEAGTLFVAPIEVCPFFARYRVAFDARQEVPEGDEVSLEFGKPIIRFDTVMVRGGTHVIVTDAEAGIIDWRLCGLGAVGMLAIALLIIEYHVIRTVQNRRRAT